MFALEMNWIYWAAHWVQFTPRLLWFPTKEIFSEKLLEKFVMSHCVWNAEL